MARDAAYVLAALALCCIMSVFIVKISQRENASSLSMLELTEFKNLPTEFKTTFRNMIPDPVAIRKQWGRMNPGQKRDILNNMSGGLINMKPQENCCNDKHAPAIRNPPVPVVAPPSPIKKGFLLKNDKKKNPKNKENDEVVTLGAVEPTVVIEEGAEESDGLTSNDGDTPFLGSDD